MPVKRHRAANGGCQASTKSGTRCAAPAVKGTCLCSLHANPKRAVEIGREGGKRNRKLYDCGVQNVGIPESPTDVKRMLAETMAEVRAGRMDPKRGTTLAYMAVAMLKAMEASDKNAPPVYPNIYRGLTTMARVVRPEEAPEEVTHREEAGTTDQRPNDVEVAPGLYRY